MPVQTTWLGFTVLRAALEALDGEKVTGRKIRQTLDGGLKVSTGGLTPTLDWGYQNGLAVIGLPSLVNTDVTIQVVRKGQLTAVKKDVTDVRSTLIAAADDVS